jgi:ADP-heptose:LPS heptosyltransferase
VRCIKKQLNAEVHYLIKPSFRSVLENNPYIDKLLSYEKGIIEKLRAEKYDIIIDLHKSIKSLLVRMKLGVKSYTYNKVNTEKWIFVNFKKDYLPEGHLVDRYFEGIKELGVINDGEGLDYFYKAEELSMELPTVYEVVVLGAAHLTKRISNELAHKGGKDVMEQAKEIKHDKIINLVGLTSLNQSAIVLSKSTLVHAGDTGLMHMAAALKVPTHVYWANTHPKMGMYPYYGDYNIYTKWYEVDDLPCRPCSKLGHPSCPKGHHKCMAHNLD